MVLLAFAVAFAVPPGIDPRHIPMGSPLGDMPIVAAPGESPRLLKAPLSEQQWLAQRRAAIARAMRSPRARAIARWVAENDRREAARVAAEKDAAPH